MEFEQISMWNEVVCVGGVYILRGNYIIFVCVCVCREGCFGSVRICGIWRNNNNKKTKWQGFTVLLSLRKVFTYTHRYIYNILVWQEQTTKERVEEDEEGGLWKHIRSLHRPLVLLGVTSCSWINVCLPFIHSFNRYCKYKVRWVMWWPGLKYINIHLCRYIYCSIIVIIYIYLYIFIFIHLFIQLLAWCECESVSISRVVCVYS